MGVGLHRVPRARKEERGGHESRDAGECGDLATIATYERVQAKPQKAGEANGMEHEEGQRLLHAIALVFFAQAPSIGCPHPDRATVEDQPMQRPDAAAIQESTTCRITPGRLPTEV